MKYNSYSIVARTTKHTELLLMTHYDPNATVAGLLKSFAEQKKSLERAWECKILDFWVMDDNSGKRV